MTKFAQTKRQWWEVRTGASNDERSSDSVVLGTFYGFVDEIALQLAHKQSGFWCDGKLTFTRAKKPDPFLPKKIHPEVNIVFADLNWNSGDELLRKMKSAFKGRPVSVFDCNQYAAVTLRRKH